MLKKKYLCPLCDGVMEDENAGDGVKILKCKDCKSEIHFGSWEAQRSVIEGENVNFVFKEKTI